MLSFLRDRRQIESKHMKICISPVVIHQCVPGMPDKYHLWCNPIVIVAVCLFSIDSMVELEEESFLSPPSILIIIS